MVAAALVAVMIVCDAEEPGGKLALASVKRKAAVGLDKRILGEIVGLGGIAPIEMPQETADGGLVAVHQLAERGAVVAADDPGDQVGIRNAHRWSLGVGAPVLRLPQKYDTIPTTSRATPMQIGRGAHFWAPVDLTRSMPMPTAIQIAPR